MPRQRLAVSKLTAFIEQLLRDRGYSIFQESSGEYQRTVGFPVDAREGLMICGFGGPSPRLRYMINVPEGDRYVVTVVGDTLGGRLLGVATNEKQVVSVTKRIVSLTLESLPG